MFKYDAAKGHQYRTETVEYIRRCLFSSDTDRPKPHHDKVLTVFKPITDALRASYDRDRLELVFNEVIFYIDCVEAEQRTLLSGGIPSKEEYWKYRMGVCCARMGLIVNEYVLRHQQTTLRQETQHHHPPLYRLDIFFLTTVFHSLQIRQQNPPPTLSPAPPGHLQPARPNHDPTLAR